MIQLEKHQMSKISPLFLNVEETLVWSCLQGYMGKAWADCIENPTCAQIITADFCFFAGDSNSSEAKLLVKNIPTSYLNHIILMIPQNDKWGALIEREYKSNFEKYLRYATKKQKNIFDISVLNGYINRLPKEYDLVPIEESLYNISSKEKWSADFCSQFESYQEYKKQGIGYAILHLGELVCGASSYTVYDGGIEIEVQTKQEHRKRGLATICASKLIVECINRGLYPSWDAANSESLSLAKKLGYIFDKEYVTYMIDCTKLER